MPELPEVKTVAKALKKSILNKRITNIIIKYDKIIDSGSIDLKELIGSEILDIETRGKYLIFHLNNYFLISHLRMEGKYFVKTKSDPIEKHEHIIIEMGDLSLRYYDTRKFGRMFLCKNINDYKSLSKIGLEPWESNVDYLLEKFKNKNNPIKDLLLDQSIITGLGNIYANEVLFASKINPYKKGSTITLLDAENIIKNSKIILEEAIKDGGTTIKSYTSSLGVIGQYQNKLKVHKRENTLCPICNNIIIKEKINGRSTYYCPNCQK